MLALLCVSLANERWQHKEKIPLGLIKNTDFVLYNPGLFAHIRYGIPTTNALSCYGRRVSGCKHEACQVRTHRRVAPMRPRTYIHGFHGPTRYSILNHKVSIPSKQRPGNTVGRKTNEMIANLAVFSLVLVPPFPLHLHSDYVKHNVSMELTNIDADKD